MKKILSPCLFVILVVVLLGANAQTAAAMSYPVKPLLLADNWLDVRRGGDIMYFVYQSPQVIKRFNLSTSTLLNDITLPGIPVAFYVDAQYLYVALDRDVYRYNLDGTAPLLLHTTGQNPGALFTCGSDLYIVDPANVSRVNVNSPGTASQKAFANTYKSVLPVCNSNLAFAAVGGTTPLQRIVIGADGSFTTTHDAHLGYFGKKLYLYLTNDQSRVIATNGLVLGTAILGIEGSFAGTMNDLTIAGDQYVVLRGKALYRYDSSFSEQGRSAFTEDVQRIAFYGNTIYGFLPLNNQITVQQVALDQLQPAYAPVVNPEGLKYEPGKIEYGDGIIYIVDHKNKNIHRWSLSETKYLSSIPLQDEPFSILFHPAHNRLYVPYQSGKVTWFDPAEPNVETAFLNLPAASCGLAAAGEFLVACISSIPNTLPYNKMVFRENKELTSTIFGGASPILSYEWHSSKSLLYTVGNYGYLYQQEVTLSGGINTGIGTTPSTSFVSLSPDGLKLLTGSGKILKWDTLAHLDTISNTGSFGISNGVWNSAGLFGHISKYEDFNHTYWIRKWDDSYQYVKEVKLWGTPKRLVLTSRGLLSVTMYQERPFFVIWDDDLSSIYPPFSTTFVPCVFNRYCADYFETFDTPFHNWYTGETASVKIDIVGGEYRLLAKQANYIWLIESPQRCTHEDYRISMDARFAQSSGTYGLVFGISPDSPEFQLFEVDPTYGSFSIWVYSYGEWNYLVFDQYNSNINTGLGKNKIEVIVKSNGIGDAWVEYLINNNSVYIGHLYKYQEEAGHGIFAAAWNVGADVRFDNYRYARYDKYSSLGTAFNQYGPDMPAQFTPQPRPEKLKIISGK